MKILSSLITIIGLGYFQTNANAQANNSLQLRWQLDSLQHYTIPVAKLKDKYKTARFNRTVIKLPIDTIILRDGTNVTYQTTNNGRLKSILSELYTISPVNFLVSIQGIEGRIVVKTRKVSWVEKKDIPDLIKLVGVDIVTPQIIQRPPEGMESTIVNNRYIKTPLGINALNLIASYLEEIFPHVTPSYESIQKWYDSGNPREAYKFEPFTPIIKDVVVSPFKK